MKKHIKFLVATILFFSPLSSVKAQNIQEGNTRITDLQQQLQYHQKEDTDRVKLLNDISNEYNRISPYDGIKYGLQSLTLAGKLNWKPGIARANSALGANYYSLSDFPNAYKFWLKALNINEALGNKTGIANHLHNIGDVYASQKNYFKALEYYNNGLKIAESAGNKKTISYSYTSIGNVYALLKDYHKALDYHLKALALDRELDVKGNIAADQVNIGSVYNNLGMYAQALEILFEAMKTKKESGDRNGIARIYNLAGNVFLNIASYVSSGANDAGRYGSKSVNLQHAVAYLDSAIAVDKEIGYLDNLQKSYEYLSDAEELAGNYKMALAGYKQAAVAKDSVYNADNRLKIANLETGRETDLKEKQIEINRMQKVEERHQQIFFTAGIALLLLVAIIAIGYYNTQKKYNALLAKEKVRHLAHIQAQDTVLADIAHTQSHDVRGPIATTLGLLQLYNHDDQSDPINSEVVRGIGISTEKLDAVIKDVVFKENQLRKETNT